MSYIGLKTLSELPLAFMKNLIVLDISFNNLKTIGPYTFLNQTRLQELVLRGNFEMLILETGAFTGLVSMSELRFHDMNIKLLSRSTFSELRLQTLDLSNNVLHDLENNAFESLEVDKLFLNESDIGAFTIDLFKGIKYVNSIVSDKYKFCCIRPEFLAEVNCYPHKDEFSSCADLMRNEFLRTLIWIMSLLALLGNSCSIGYRFIYDRKRLSLGYGIFVSNLAVSDFLMGVYLIIIASADQHFRGNYFLHSDTWTGSTWCQFAGVIASISSETSVMLMCLITFDRILVIKFPFGQFRITPKIAGLLVSFVWLIALVIAILPISYYRYFKGAFYSKTGVCLALPLTRDKPPGWEYSIVFFIGFNSITFLLVACGQYLIYREINKSKKSTGASRYNRDNDLKVARNLLMVVTTDFLCWFPVGILGIHLCKLN